MNNVKAFSTNDINLASFLQCHYNLIKASTLANGRVTFHFPDSPMLRQRVFDFFSKNADANIADFCDNLRRLKALTINSR